LSLYLTQIFYKQMELQIHSASTENQKPSSSILDSDKKKQTPYCRMKKITHLAIKDNPDFKTLLFNDLIENVFKNGSYTQLCDVCKTQHCFNFVGKTNIPLKDFCECDLCEKVAVYNFSIDDQEYNLCFECKTTKIIPIK
jgi:hypothetical protein